jgi:hypothetical protein
MFWPVRGSWNKFAEQVGDDVPPNRPLQFQLQGPLPVIADVVPFEQRRLFDGKMPYVWPLALPQVPVVLKKPAVAVVSIEDIVEAKEKLRVCLVLEKLFTSKNMKSAA